MVDNLNFPKLGDIDSKHTSAQNVKSKWPEFYAYLISLNYPNDIKFSEKLYWYFHNISSYPVCKICGKQVSYINFTKGYSTYCCTSCSRKDPESIKKREQTNLKKYGTKNPCQSKIVQDKIEQTMLDRYGVKRALQNKEFLEKSQNTCEKHYGVKYPSQNVEILERQKQTLIEKYRGVGLGSNIIKEKAKRTNLERYGYGWGWESDEVRQKSLETWREKYGVENPFAASEIKEKIKQINLERYGVENPGWTEESQEKIKQSNLEKFGVEYAPQSKEVIEKIFATKKENGTSCSSQIEQDFKQWLIDNNIEFDHQHHDNIYPFDCDFYFPKTNTYLEIQGSWVHGPHPYNEENKDDRKLLNKWNSKINENDSCSFYKTAIYTWTVRDVNKRNWAKEHNLNWHEVFTTDLNILINECCSLNIF